MTTFSVAACLAKVADAEWVRVCESVRRCAPTVGMLGEWRAMCEGGWTGPIPQALPDNDDPATSPQLGTAPSGEDQGRDLQAKVAPQGRDASANGSEREPPQYVPHDSARENPDLHAWNMPSATSSSDLSNHNVNARTPQAQLAQDRYNSATSLASLASFPSPPTHVPPPLVASPLGSRTVSLETGDNADSSQKAVSFPLSVTNMGSSDPKPQEPKSAKSGETLQNAETDASDLRSPTSQYQAQEDGNDPRSTSMGQSPVIDTRPTTSETRPLEQSGKSVETARKDNQLPQPTPSNYNDTSSMSSGSAAHRKRDSAGYPKGNYADDREFGMRHDAGSPVDRRDAGKALERSESVVSAGSVAALRNRYSYTVYFIAVTATCFADSAFR